MPLAIPFGASNSSLQGLAPPTLDPLPLAPLALSQQAEPPTLLPSRRSASGITSPRAPGTPAPSPTSVGFQAVAQTTPGGPVPRPLLPLSDYHIRTPYDSRNSRRSSSYIQTRPGLPGCFKLLSVVFLLVLLALIPLIYLVI